MSQVFISYATKSKNSKDFVQELKSHLVEAGFDVWVDDVLQAGQNWQVEIDNAIKASFAVIIIITPEANESRYVTYEWAFALGAGKEIIPVLLESSDSETNPNRKPHPRLDPTHLQYLDCTRHFPAPYEKVVQTVFAKATGLDQKKQEVPLFVKLAVNALESYEPEDRKTAINRLTQSKHPLAIEALADAVQHHIKDVRLNAALTLTRVTSYNDKRAIPGLREALTGDKRHEATVALQRIGSYEAVATLLDHLNEATFSQNLRDYYGGDFLSELSKSEGLPLLLEALHHQDDYICGYAARALGRVGGETCIDSLLEVFNLREGFPKRAVVLAFADIGSEKPLSSLEKCLSQFLSQEELNFYRPEPIVLDIIYALGKIGSSESLPLLLEVMEAIETADLNHQIRYPEHKSSYLDEDNILVVTLKSITRVADDRAIPCFVRKLDDTRDIHSSRSIFSHSSIKDIAVNGLKRIASKEALAVLENWHTTKNNGDDSEEDIPF